MTLNTGKESMTDAEKKGLLVALVESCLDGEIYEGTYCRISAQMHFAKLCGIITESESKELEGRVRTAARGERLQKGKTKNA